eukprot:jgi/Galph1/340/GphlegSOOS_G5018.1
MASGMNNLLLETFPRDPPLSYLIFYGAVAVPLFVLDVYVFLAVLHLNPLTSSISIAVGTVAGVVLLAISYHKTAYAVWSRLDRTTDPPSKSSFKGKVSSYEVAVKEHQRRLERTSISYSIMLNNGIFQSFVLTIGFYLLKDKIPDELNFIITIVLSAIFVRLNSESSFKSVHA